MILIMGTPKKIPIILGNPHVGPYGVPRKPFDTTFNLTSFAVGPGGWTLDLGIAGSGLGLRV